MTGASDSQSSSSSSSSSAGDELDSSQPTVYDEQIFSLIRAALLARASEAESVGPLAIEGLARKIACEFAQQLETPRAQLRTLLFNLRDAKNRDFVRDVLTRTISPAQLPQLPSEYMASREK